MDLVAIPLAFLAGVLSLLSPCVLPMIPVVASSAVRSSRKGIIMLALGLSLSFALAGTLLTFALISLGLSPEVLRYFSASLLLFIAAAILIQPIGDWLTLRLSLLMSRLPNHNVQGDGVLTQFAVGASLGLVWLPCVGPTLGAAIALASTGQSLGSAFLVMLAFGIGTAIPLIGFSLLVRKSLSKWATKASVAKKVMGVSLILLSLIIFTGFDRTLEMLALDIMPEWLYNI
ncbi:cytochrome C biogenesis protein CcdA [Psychrosphaera saromensis]|jgi:cytochrome c biogenesis protein CcdA|uniref:Cytochrome C biogenesis protein n=1 Tax=Psychrosphaera saromensis TaxID=716813 RepID=A0A2S7UVP0_9GAMM|nr:cytochrome c biogenesis CcdA family protein [Psychrosphaera saromensis]PQJ53572.1 cytochrome C biogenesis protein [Psychrosphaera saromensis]GHB64193.1 cytochrome C biogenesis protein CcdA [Psychrosphaera saromensis]GLQ15670.1 cytochrome C biogenesis protein CcdA [Psychrosphaera saromensis]